MTVIFAGVFEDDAAPVSEDAVEMVGVTAVGMAEPAMAEPATEGATEGALAAVSHLSNRPRLPSPPGRLEACTSSKGGGHKARGVPRGLGPGFIMRLPTTGWWAIAGSIEINSILARAFWYHKPAVLLRNEMVRSKYETAQKMLVMGA